MTDVVVVPFVEDVGKKIAIAFAGDLPTGIVHDGEELQVMAVDLVAEELVDFQTSAFAVFVYHTEGVECYVVLVEQLNGFPDSLKIAAVGVVNGFGSVDGQADEEVVIGKKLGPRCIQAGPVGLQGVVDGFVAPVLLLQVEGPPVEVDSGQGGFAAVPAEGYRVAFVGLDVLLDVGFQQRFAHGFTSSPGVVAIAAVQVTPSTYGFDQGGKGPGTGEVQGTFQGEGLGHVASRYKKTTAGVVFCGVRIDYNSSKFTFEKGVASSVRSTTGHLSLM